MCISSIRVFTSRRLGAGKLRLTHFLRETWLWGLILQALIILSLPVNVPDILSMICSSCLLSCPPHSLGQKAAGERMSTFTKGRPNWVFFFFFFCLFSKIAVGGALMLQVLLMWTVISLGGFPANCPHHPSLPQTHTSKHSQRPYLQNLLFISQENHRRGNAAAGRPLLCVWIFWSSSKMKSMWWKWPDINKPSGHKPIQQIPCDLCLHSVLCSFFKDFLKTFVITFILVCNSIIFAASWRVQFRLYPEQGWESRALYSKVLLVVAVQSLSRVQLFVTPGTAARQASLSFTILPAFAQTCVCLSWWCHQFTMSTWVYFWTLSSIPLIYVSFLMLGPHCLMSVDF